MARINFEDRIYKDKRFHKLLALEQGDSFRAIGICVSAWELGMAWYLKSPNRNIPMAEWDKAEIPKSFIDAGLAKLTDSGVRITGADEHFAFLIKLQEAGERGGKSKSRNHKGKVLANASLGKPNVASFSFSPSFSSSSSDSFSDGFTAAEKKSPPSDSPQGNLIELGAPHKNGNGEAGKVKTLGSRIFERYADLIFTKYGKEPLRNKKVNSQCKQLGERLGEDALEVLKFYVEHNEASYIRSHHAIGYLLGDAEALHMQWQRGKKVTRQDVWKAEKQRGPQDQIARIEAGEL